MENFTTSWLLHNRAQVIHVTIAWYSSLRAGDRLSASSLFVGRGDATAECRKASRPNAVHSHGLAHKQRSNNNNNKQRNNNNNKKNEYDLSSRRAVINVHGAKQARTLARLRGATRHRITRAYDRQDRSNRRARSCARRSCRVRTSSRLDAAARPLAR